ncbi:ribosomal protein L10-domain-containing protein [Phakopsora pachyrhizi]|uniref:Ribosome assembly factor mrt4 n=1 Tax=Phakopsora pachyrhizi TaxID=170000 RepID=A0AAV0ASN9_PHAPC|nr:ribosomal protein L10-domain-containing protein [Phakopsora pachyrhizi]CAH7671171.1 ribosomal protein L10-domain-containing protein [Phakopsora pachyrhizi]
MPKSKRSTIVNLTKTNKKTKESKSRLIDRLRLISDQFKFCWLFEVENVRNNHLQEIRSSWKQSKIFIGKNALMRIGLGVKVEDEHLPGLSELSNLIEGNVGLLFTDESPRVVLDWFDDYIRDEYARKGNLATETVELPEGPVMIKQMNEDPIVAPGSLEVQLRNLGLPTKLERGVPRLSSSFEICKLGEKLDTEKANLLRILGYQMAKFRINLLNVWVKDRCKTFGVQQIRDELAKEIL